MSIENTFLVGLSAKIIFMGNKSINNLTDNKLLAKNTLYSLIGQGAPLIAALAATPILINRLGIDRFGILTMTWMVISYFSLFDLGLGRALTQLVSEKLGAGLEKEVPPLFWSSSILMLLLGILGAFVLFPLSPWLTYKVIKIPDLLQRETLLTLYELSLSIPIVVSTAGLVGFLSAYQRFDLVNLVKIPTGLLMMLIPLIVVFFTHSLVYIVAGLIINRFLAWIAYIILCFRVLPTLKKTFSFEVRKIGPLINFGGWMTITNFIGPVMVYLDRFLIGSVISISAVTYYTTPYELVTKLWILPGSIVSVLFPAFSSIHKNNIERRNHLFIGGIKKLYLILFPLVLITINFAREGLQFWLGGDFAIKSYFVLQILAIGVLVNSIAQIPFALIQAAGKPDITSKLHLIELPLYLLFLNYQIHQNGIEGTAIAWLFRIIADTFLLFLMTRILFQIRLKFSKKTYGIALMSLISVTLGMISNWSVIQKIGLTAMEMFIFIGLNYI
jgi:O-antigen/teichoic acid export membrane protein